MLQLSLDAWNLQKMNKRCISRRIKPISNVHSTFHYIVLKQCMQFHQKGNRFFFSFFSGFALDGVDALEGVFDRPLSDMFCMAFVGGVAVADRLGA